MPIARNNPFQHQYGDVRENMFAFMLEELDDDVDTLLERLGAIDRNLDAEIEKLAEMIGDAGPRSSTRYAEIALRLTRNLHARVSETLTNRGSTAIAQSTAYDHDLDDMSDILSSMTSVNGKASNRTSRALTQQSSNPNMALKFAEELKLSKVDEVAEDEDDLLNQCEIYRQIKIESIKANDLNVSDALLKEKQLRCFKKLEDLKIQLVELIAELQQSVTYNPFKGTN